MQLVLPTNTFSFFKVWFGTLFLAGSFFFPAATFLFTAIFIVGRTHAIGAWIAMWRAKKLNWKYVAWVFVISVVVAYYGMGVIPMNYLRFGTFLLFAFHFFFDEFDLQEERRTLVTILHAAPPFVLMVSYLIFDFMHIPVQGVTFLTLALLFFIIEMLFIKEINWFFVHTKIITGFIILCVFFRVEAPLVSSIFLMFHYLFWFIYPVYKLHKYKREERDGLIFALLLITFPVVYISVSGSPIYDVADDVARRAFLVGTIVHILTTAPFGYLIGLPKSVHYAVAK